MCGAGGGNNKSSGGKSGGNNNKPAKKKNIIKEIFTPTPESIAKNKIAGAKFTASQKAKGIGVARSNITDGGGNRIKGVANSQSNPALQKLAKEGKRGAEGLNTLAARQSAQTGKDTSFSGIAKSLMSGEKHAPRQSLLQFGSGTQTYDHSGYNRSSGTKAKSPNRIALTTEASEGGSSGGSNQSTASSSGTAGATGQASNLKNMLAVNKSKKRLGKRKLTNKGVGVGGSGYSGLNIIS
jgi:hypothetical protein